MRGLGSGGRHGCGCGCGVLGFVDVVGRLCLWSGGFVRLTSVMRERARRSELGVALRLCCRAER